MFFAETDLPVTISYAGMNTITKQNFPFFQNVRYHRQHKMVLSIEGKTASMTVDDLPESRSVFPFQKPPYGCISLATCSTIDHLGGVTYLRISEKDQVVFELDFRTLTDVEALAQWFDCYYFKELKSKQPGRKENISQFWGISGTHALHCTQPPRHVIPDRSHFCLLTLRDYVFTDCTIELGFEQSWVCYGIVFGCELGHFPYYFHPKTHAVHSSGGGYAYVEAEGYQTIRGDLTADPDFSPQLLLIRRENSLDTFSDNLTREISTNKIHSLTFHVNANAQYTFADRQLNIRSGTITYLPPNTQYELNLLRDTQLSVEFTCYKEIDCAPAYLEVDNPKEYERLFHKLINAFSANQGNGNYECLSLFYRILAIVQKEFRKPEEDISSDFPPLLQKAMEYITDNFNRPDLSISEIAAYCEVSEVYFRKIFNKHMHISPKKYILLQQIDYAKFLLDSHFYKIYEISEKCGFDNSNYFISVFKRLTGMTPKAYAEQLVSPPNPQE